MLPPNFPVQAPIVYLDEPEKADVVEMIDYLDKTNLIINPYIQQWQREGQAQLGNGTFNLIHLSSQVY